MPDSLTFRRVTGEPVTAEVSSYGADIAAGGYLLGRIVELGDVLELRQHRPVSGPQRDEGYERLDNEILAGRRLHEVTDWDYPSQVSRLYGDEAASAEPYTLFEPYEGRPLREVGGYMGDDEFEAFVTSFLTGLCWIAAAGIAHRMISPETVLWDTQRGVLITDFSRSTIFGIPRTVLTGYTGWVPQELRTRSCSGTAGPRDDIWAAGRLIFFARNQGGEPTGRDQFADLDVMFNGLFNPVFGPAEHRPTAWELLEDGLRRRVSLPSAAERSERLKSSRKRFLDLRQREHPDAVTPSDFNADLDWMGPPATPVNGHHPASASPPSAQGAPAYPPVPADGAWPDATIPVDVWPEAAPRSRHFPRRRGDA
jgi:serine/threonine protein kinase